MDTVRRFIRQELAPLEDEVEVNGVLAPDQAAAIHAKSRALGLYAMNIRAEHGGGGQSAVDTMLCEEQFGHTSDILIRRAFGNLYEALLACRSEQVERWLRPTLRGERVCSIAITEPGAGSDAAAIATRATLDAQGYWHLSGHKHFISDGLVSDFFLVSAVTGAVNGKKEISLFLVDKGLSGFMIDRDQPMMGLRGTSHVELWFDDVTLGPECLLGERGLGFKMAMDVLGRVVNRAVQIFGGMGYFKEAPIERWYRDARIYRIFDGTSEIHRDVIARGLARRRAAVFELNR